MGREQNCPMEVQFCFGPDISGPYSGSSGNTGWLTGTHPNVILSAAKDLVARTSLHEILHFVQDDTGAHFPVPTDVMILR